jgi:hypothetical protein
VTYIIDNALKIGLGQVSRFQVPPHGSTESARKLRRRMVRSVFVDGLFRKRRPLDLEQTTETAWTTITLAIRQVNS